MSADTAADLNENTLPMPIHGPLSKAQRTQIVNLMRRAARTEVMPRFKSLSAHQIQTKTDAQDLVTDADRAAEKMIARGLLAMFPNALIVGEEAASEDDSVVGKIADAEMAFTIDPVDGTWNFAHGLTVFGMILSMTRFGQPVFSALYDPVMDDLIVAEEGGTTQLVRKGKPVTELSTSNGGAIEQLTGYTSLHRVPEAHQAELVATFPRFTRISSLRCSCQEFRMLAQGHIDFILTTGLTPWDHAAGVLAVRQAGGHAALLSGEDYNAGSGADAYLLCASDAATWGRLAEVFGFLSPAAPATAQGNDDAAKDTSDADTSADADA